jgi:hypothetical protein
MELDITPKMLGISVPVILAVIFGFIGLFGKKIKFLKLKKLANSLRKDTAAKIKQSAEIDGQVKGANDSNSTTMEKIEALQQELELVGVGWKKTNVEATKLLGNIERRLKDIGFKKSN